jgi:hypothetical protein
MPSLYPSSSGAAGVSAPIPLTDRPVDLEDALVWMCAGKHVLFTRGDARVLVNGRPVPAGIRVLAHRDQIHAGSFSWWFSGEDPARVEPFPGSEAVICPRCRQQVVPGSDAVRCPCNNWFHRSDVLMCFDYAGACPVCRRPTTLAPLPVVPEED